MKRALHILLSIISIESLLLTPLLGSMLVQAATTPSSTSQTCNPQAIVAGTADTGAAYPTTIDPSAADYDPGDVDPSLGENLTAVSLSTAQQNPFFDQATFTSRMQEYAKNDKGYYDSTSQTWYFCANDNLSYAASPAGLGYDDGQYISTLQYPVNKLTFDNPLDAYALTGDPCTLFDPITNICNEDTTPQTVTNSDGTTTTTQVPKYYQDEFNTGHWDAPKADARILQTLVYLVTPVDQGGAGQESIEVGEIIQPGKTDADFTDPNAVSSHYYDSSDPENPSVIATGLTITGIGNLRITTKITTGRLVTSTSYQYSSIPIKVAYQTDQGVSGASSPTVSNLYQGALSSFTSNLGTLLTSLGLNATIDLTNVNLDNLGDIAKLIGGSLITTLLNSPTGSLAGWDVGSLLNTLGRAYIAQQLGLNPNVLAYGDTSDDFVRDVGQATVEQALQLPSGSLAGATAPDIWGNVGRRFLEDAIGVTPNTLQTGTTYSQSDFLQRIGAGYVEQKLGFQPQSLQTTDWNTLAGSIKGKLIFTQTNSSYIDSELNLGFQPTASNSSVDEFGFTANDFKDPAGAMMSDHSSAGIAHFFQVVGSRAVELSLGKFTPQLSGVSGQTAAISPNQNCGSSCVNPISSIDNALMLGGSFNPLYTQNNVLSAAQESSLNQLLTSQLGLLNQQSTSDATLVSQYNASVAIQNFLQTAQTNITNAVGQADAGDASNSSATANCVPDEITGACAALPQCGVASGENTLLALQSSVTCAENTLEDYQDGIFTALDTSGQSGMSAALDLPGTLYSVNSDGTLGSPVLTTDPVTSFLSGNVSSSLMQAVGKIVIGSKLATSKSTQRSLAGQIQHSTSTTYQTVPTINQKTGQISSVTANALLGALNPTIWVNSGLQVSDFETIFSKDLSSTTFDQIGSQVMLSSLWNKYGSATAQNFNSTTGNALSTVASQINQITSDISFYTSRLADIKSISQTLYSQILPLDNIPQGVKDQLSALNLQNPNQTPQDIQNIALGYEAAMGQSSFQQLPTQIQSEITKVNQDAQEIMAGHSLSFTGTGTTSSTAIANGCFNPLVLQNYLQNKVSGSISDIAIQTAACRFDAALSLPLGSTYLWYQSKDYSLTGLERAVGQAYAKSVGTTYSDDDAVTKGQQILEGAAVKTLVGQIPGISSVLNKLDITPTDILNLMTGNTSALAEKLGGKMMDSYFNWQPGTGAALINPQCLDPTTKQYVTCTGADATYVRENVLASAGLKALGLQLNFPSTFNLFGSGDFSTNYGNADISQTLGLAPNTFTGDFSAVRGSNDPQTLLTGFGWYPNLLIQNLTTLSSDLAGGLVYGNVQNDAQAAITAIDNAVLNAMSDPTSPIWGVTAATLSSPATTSFASDLLTSELSIYNGALTQIKTDFDQANAAYPDGAPPVGLLGTDIDTLIGQYQNQSSSTPSSTLISQTANQMLIFDQRVTSLDGQAGATPGSFKSFITGGGTDADTISKDDGAIRLGSVIDQIVNNNILNGTPFEGLFGRPKGDTTPTVLQQVSTALGCGSSLDLGSFLLGSTASKQAVGCTLSSISGMSLASFFQGFNGSTLTGTVGAGTATVDPQIQAARESLIQGLLVSSWGMNFQKGLNLDPGTMAAIALRPMDAPEIAIDQGLKILGNQIFGPQLQNNTAQLNTVVTALRQSVVAGFCPVDITGSTSSTALQSSDLQEILSAKGTCTLDFNAKRALASFKNDMLNSLGSAIGTNQMPKGFSLIDVGVLLAGGTQAIYLDGLAHMAALANAQILSHPNANPALLINFNDIRAAAGLSFLTPAAQQAAGDAAAANWIRQNADYLPSDNLSNADLIAWYETTYADPLGTMTAQQKIDAVEYQQLQGASTISSQAQHAAQTALQYKIYDIAAYSVDPDIPPGFTHAMFAGTNQERTQALELYAVNILYDHTTLKNIGLSPQELTSVATFGINCFGSKQDCDSYGPTLVGPLNKIQNYIFKSTGLSSLNPPQNLLEGLVAWGSDGFDPSDFMDPDNSLGSIQHIPGVGISLENWGISNLLTWGDKEFGFPVGSLYQIYQATTAYLAAEGVLSSVGTSVAMGDFDVATGQFIDPTDEANYESAQKEVQAGPATIANLVIDTVFRSQLAGLEKSLGLSPGSGATMVSILTQMATTDWAVPWLSVATLIIMNVFGFGVVSISKQATGDGYYPYTGQYGGTRLDPLEYPSPDPPVGQFDALNPQTYTAGLETAAQAKVYAVLQDLLLMPSRWGAATGVSGNNLWISQVYTARQSDLQNLNYLISQPPPWDNLGTFGYGTPSERGSISYDSSGNPTVTPTQSSGFFYDPGCNSSSTLGGVGVTTSGTSPSPATSSSPSASPSTSAGASPVTSPSSTAGALASGSGNTQQCVFGSNIYLRF